MELDIRERGLNLLCRRLYTTFLQHKQCKFLLVTLVSSPHGPENERKGADKAVSSPPQRFINTPPATAVDIFACILRTTYAKATKKRLAVHRNTYSC